MNLSILYFLNSFAATHAPEFFAFLAEDFGYVLILVLLYFLLTHEDRKRGTRELLVILSAAALAWILAHVIKYFYYTPRPFVALQNVNLLFPHEADGSFPSGHAAFSAALSMAMYFSHKRLPAVLAVGALIIGIARVAAGVHFPIDIIAGFVLGAIIAGTAYLLIRKLFQSLDLQNG